MILMHNQFGCLYAIHTLAKINVHQNKIRVGFFSLFEGRISGVGNCRDFITKVFQLSRYEIAGSRTVIHHQDRFI